MRYRLLYVEDSSEFWDEVKNAFTATQYAESFDFVDIFAPTNEYAIEALRQSRPDVVLLDIRLRGDTPCYRVVEYIYKEYLKEYPNAQVPFVIFYSVYWNDTKPQILELTMGLPTARIDKDHEFWSVPERTLEAINQCVLPFNAHQEIKKVNFKAGLDVAPHMVLWVHYTNKITRVRFVHNTNIFICDREISDIAKDLGAVNVKEVNEGKRSQFIFIERNLILNNAYLLLDKNRNEICFQRDLNFSDEKAVKKVSIDTAKALEHLLLWWISHN